MADPNLSEIITTTMKNRRGKLEDNVTKQIAIYNRLAEKGNVLSADGGDAIYQELEYAQNGTYKRYIGGEPLDITPQTVFTMAQFDWKQVAISVQINGLEEIQNAGKERKIDLISARIKNAERSFRNNFAADMYSDGTADGSKQIGGLQLLVADSPSTGTVGGINRANWTFWRNQIQSGTTVSAANVQNLMQTLFLKMTRTGDQVDLILADNNFYQFYWQSLVAIQRITESKMAQMGFQALKFQNADVVFDGGYGGSCPANHAYFLNTDYVKLRPSSERNYKVIGGERQSINQDLVVKIMGWGGNMTISNAFLQGVLTN